MRAQCSKAYIHSRMRAKTSDFLKVLNRARPEQKATEKKTITYVFTKIIMYTSLTVTGIVAQWPNFCAAMMMLLDAESGTISI